VIPVGGIGAGVDWKVGGLGNEARLDTVGGEQAATAGSGFGEMLTKQIGALESRQVEAADATRALADGTATDPSSVVVAVEKARLAMQLASQLRTKGVEAFNDLIHTQV
jgi:flagellar hook-basal body complex protein FliE